MIRVDNDVTPNFQPQKSILKQMEETMMVLQRPKPLHAPIIQQEEFSQQSMLLKEIDFFCQKLTTVKKTKPKVEDVSTKQFTCSTPEIQQLKMLVEPDEMDEQQHQVKFADYEQQELEKVRTIPNETTFKKRTGIVKQKIQPKLTIKKLEFELENPLSWIPVKIEKKLEQELKLNLNLCIYWPEEELANLQTENINILSLIESMKNINYFNHSIKQKNNNNFQDLIILNIQFLQKLKIYSIILCLNYIYPIRELCIRANDIKKELLSDSLYERKKSMLLLEQKRILKKIFLRYLLLRVKYKGAIDKMLNDVIQIRQKIKQKQFFQKLYQYSQRNKQKNEFQELVHDHMRVRSLNTIFQNWRMFHQCLVKQRQMTECIKKIIIKQSLQQWKQITKSIIQQEQIQKQIQIEQRQKEQAIEYINEESDEDDNKVLSQFLTDEKPRNMYEGPNCLNDLYTFYEREVQAKKIKVIIFELKEDLKLCPNLMQKVFIKWKIAFLQRHRHKEFIEIMKLKKIQKIFQFWKNDKEYHSFYKSLLKRKGLEGFRYNQLTNKQQKLQDQLKIITLKQQRQQIDEMAKEVYNNNIKKKAFLAWKYIQKNDNLQALWQSLSDQKLKQDFQIVQLKYDIIQKKRKIKYFKKWVVNFIKSRRSIKNLQQCEVTAKEKAIESLIRIAFDTSMKTQFKWLEYYKDN
ncbi:unnamed protein product [Paramecium primaurelia]|uniref:Sfi1 spindle body domain-containing protein n=1 Tax=Paramecium primaurelia TaxID=5886 RepID=A0A8S1Q159_PARPR|nr:unnamed protein product [Paramecium primaurelia]